MKKVLLSLWIILIFHNGISAQIELDSVLATYDELDWSHFSSGILYNRIPFHQLGNTSYNANPLNFNSSTQNYAVDAVVFEQLYYDFSYADRYERFFDKDFDFDAARVDWQKEHDVPIGLLAFEFDYIKPNACDELWMQYDTARGRFVHLGDTIHFQDSIPTDTSLSHYTYVDTLIYRPKDSIAPYVLGKTHVMAVSLLNRAVGLYDINEPVRYFVPASVYNNAADGRSFVNISIDFGDGNGWRPLSRDAEFDIYYSSFGTKTVRTRMRSPSEEVPVAQTFSVSVYQKIAPPDAIVSSFTPSPCTNQLNVKNAGEALLTLRYAEGNTSLTKPVLLVEDFDERVLKDTQGNVQRNEQAEGYGSVGYQSLNIGLIYDEVGNETFRYTYSRNMADSLHEAGFDLVILDFKDPRASIETNGKTVMLAIDWINQQLNNAEAFGVLGLGTGGLLANYALNRFEESPCCHNVSKFISFDTPYKGLNVPLSLQFHAEYYNSGNSTNGKLFGNKGRSAHALADLMNSPLFQEIVVYNLYRTDVYNMGRIDPLPQDCYNIAIANGSLQGNGYTFGQSDELFIMGVKQYLDEFSGQFVGEHLNYRRDKPRAIAANNQWQTQQIMEYRDAGTLNSGDFHRTRNKIAWIIAVAILLAAVASAFDWAGVAVGIVILIAADIWAEQEVDIYNNKKEYITLSAETLAYDNAPGSRSMALGGLFSSERSYLYKGYRIQDDFALNYIDEFSLVPTVSALGIDTEDLYTNIESLTLEEEKTLIPFDKYYTDPEQGSAHQYHVEFTERNAQFIADEMREIHTSSFTQTTINLNAYYNFGREGEKRLGHVVVQNGGNLSLNEDQPWGYTGQGGALPPLANAITAKTKACGAHIEVQNGGTLQLGDNTYVVTNNGQQRNNRTTFSVQANGTLELMSGASLIIRDSSALIIEPGGSLIIHPGANIHLDGAGAMLELQGRLRLEPQAIFSPYGNGILRFNQDMDAQSASDFLDYGGQNSCFFGDAYNAWGMRLQIWQNTWFTQVLDSLGIQNIEVELAQSRFLAVQGLFYSRDAQYTLAEGSMVKHGGLRLFGQEKVNISHCEFSGANNGILALLSTYGNPLSISDCYFYQCGNGLQTQGKRVFINNCFFDDNAAGWWGRDHDGACSFVNSHARQCNSGVNFNGQMGSSLLVQESFFQSNQYGLRISESEVRSQCSEYLYNLYGLEASSSSVDLAQQAQNTFNNSYDDIVLNGAHACRMKDGSNIFSQGNSYVNGTLSTNAIPSLHNTGTGYALPVGSNLMPALNGSIAVSLSLQANPIGLYNWAPVNTYPTYCGTPGYTGQSSCGTCAGKTLQMGAYNNQYLHEVIDDAATYLVADESLGDAADNLLAMDMLQDVFNFVQQEARYGTQDPASAAHVFDEDERQMMDIAYVHYMQALSNAYRFGMLEGNRADPEGSPHTYVQHIVSEAQYRLHHQVPTSADPYLKGFQYRLAIPQAYRIGEYYTQALQTIGAAETEAQAAELTLALYWRCVYEAEEAFILGETEVDDFLAAQQGCVSATQGKWSGSGVALHSNSGVAVSDVVLPNPINTHMERSRNEQSRSTELMAYPNPSQNGQFTLELPPSKQAYTYSVYNAEGRCVQKGSLNEGQRLLRLNKALGNGAYQVKIKQNTLEIGRLALMLLR
jgi:hypothetical protein